MDGRYVRDDGILRTLLKKLSCAVSTQDLTVSFQDVQARRREGARRISGKGEEKETYWRCIRPP